MVQNVWYLNGSPSNGTGHPYSGIQVFGQWKMTRTTNSLGSIGGKYPPLTGKQKVHYRGAKFWHGHNCLTVFAVRRFHIPPEISAKNAEKGQKGRKVGPSNTHTLHYGKQADS